MDADELFDHICHRCGHGWISLEEIPAVCPRCKNPEWSVPVPVWHCLQCGNVWRGRSYKAPHVCPRCKSPRWGTFDVITFSSAGAKLIITAEGRAEYERILAQITPEEREDAGAPIWFNSIFGSGERKDDRATDISDRQSTTPAEYMKTDTYKRRAAIIQALDRYRLHRAKVHK